VERCHPGCWRLPDRGSPARSSMSVSRVGSAQPGWIAVPLRPSSYRCRYAALAGCCCNSARHRAVPSPSLAHRHRDRHDQLRTGRAGGSLHLTGTSNCGDTRCSGPSRHSRCWSPAVGIVTLVLLAASGLAVAPRFAAQARLPVLARGRDPLAAVLGRRNSSRRALAVRHLGGATPRPSRRSRQSPRVVACARLSHCFRRCSSLRCPRSSGPDIQSASGRALHAWSTRLRNPDSSRRRRHDRSTMSAGLVLAGSTSTAVIRAVLLYRIVSAWPSSRSAGTMAHHAPAHGAQLDQLRHRPNPATGFPVESQSSSAGLRVRSADDGRRRTRHLRRNHEICRINNHGVTHQRWRARQAGGHRFDLSANPPKSRVSVQAGIAACRDELEAKARLESSQRRMST